MKKCPFCAEEIQDAAIKCRHCNEFIDPRFKPAAEHRPWYFTNTTVIAAVLALMALALPLVWFNPYYSRARKILITIVVVGLTVLLWMGTAHLMKMLDTMQRQIM